MIEARNVNKKYGGVTALDDFTVDIPEGKIGINPGIMSISKKIDIVHHYGKPSIK